MTNREYLNTLNDTNFSIEIYYQIFYYYRNHLKEKTIDSLQKANKEFTEWLNQQHIDTISYQVTIESSWRK